LLATVVAHGGPSLFVVIALIFSAALHAGWNASAHRIPDQAVGFALIGLASGGVALCALPFVSAPSQRAWPFLLTSAAMHVVYNLLLLRSYRSGEFSQMYPIARGTSPLVVTLLAITVVGESLGVRQVTGVLLICAGLITLASAGGNLRRAGAPAVRAAVLTGLMIASYTVVDGVGVRRADSTAGYIVGLFVLQGPVTAVLVLRSRRRTFAEIRPYLLEGLTSGVVSLLAYGIVIWAQTQGTLATVAALRELSILFGALIGVAFFHERFGRWRLAGATLAVVGILLTAS
jgi:drug/metabolite transporter (DMT)-like permease